MQRSCLWMSSTCKVSNAHLSIQYTWLLPGILRWMPGLAVTMSGHSKLWPQEDIMVYWLLEPKDRPSLHQEISRQRLGLPMPSNSPLQWYIMACLSLKSVFLWSGIFFSISLGYTEALATLEFVHGLYLQDSFWNQNMILPNFCFAWLLAIIRTLILNLYHLYIQRGSSFLREILDWLVHVYSILKCCHDVLLIKHFWVSF